MDICVKLSGNTKKRVPLKPLRIAIINIHGLLKSTGLEIGRDADNGGQTRYVYEFAEYLSRHPDVGQVHLITRLIDDPALDDSYALPVEIINDKLDIRRIPFAGKRYRLKEDLWPYLDEFVTKTIQYLKAHAIIPDWIHSHYGDAGYAAVELSNLLKVPFVHTGHSLGIAKKDKLKAMGMTEEEGERKFKFTTRIAAENATLLHANFIITSTDQERETYEQYPGFDQAVFHTIAPGVDTEKFVPYYELQPGVDQKTEEMQRRYWVSEYIEKFLSYPNKPCILALSRPDLRKNLHTLIDVYGNDKELQSMANLVIFAGIRKDIEKMPESEREVLVHILLLMDKYDLYGKLAIPKKHDVENEVATIYRYCADKRGVFTNLALHENFGLTIIESASSGLPVVSTKNGGPAEIIPQCENGILIDPMDAREIASAIKRIITDDQLWRSFSNSGVINAQKFYSWQHHVDQYMKLVKASLSKGKPVREVGPGLNRMKLAKYLFATDIDGTLISEEHDHPGLEDLKVFLNHRPDHMALAYASGRSVKLVRNVIKDMDLPEPEFLVCSVGSQIYYKQGNDYILDKGWSAYLKKNWNREEVGKRMESLDWLELQEAEGQNPHKISYYLKDKQFKEGQLKAVLGKLLPQLTIILSHDLYLDILPKQASKGKALRYICKKWSIPYSNLITAGDSGNDLDMLTGSGKGIIVGNHASELGRVKAGKNLYRSAKYAAEGILEGLEHYGILPISREVLEEDMAHK